MQVQRKKYGIQHYVAGEIHSAMVDTLPLVATSLSMNDNNASMWDKWQLLVILSHTKWSKAPIFVVNKEITLNALVRSLKNGHNGHNIWDRYWR